MSNLKLSIIVPIYNVESYLRKCVDSLLTQDLSIDEYEIILVDDGSPDGCPAICDEYQRTMPNIKVIHRENGGLSAARNSGLTFAQGKYVQFVDSDDYLEQNVLGRLVAQMEQEGLDVLRFDYQNVRIVENQYKIFEPNKEPHKADERTDVVDGITYLNERMGYACYAVMYMMKRSLLVQKNKNKTEDTNKSQIFFTEGIHFEDVDWTPRMLLAAKRVNSTTCVVYNYLHRDGSITKVGLNVERIRKNVEDCILIIGHLGALYEAHSQCIWLKKMQSMQSVGVINILATKLYANRKQYLEQLHQYNVFPLLLANQSKTYQKRARLINFSPNVYIYLMHLLRK